MEAVKKEGGAVKDVLGNMREVSIHDAEAVTFMRPWDGVQGL
jgi:hypothetical protein